MPENLRESFDEFRKLGYDTILLWGAEYWHFRGLRHGDKQWWEGAAELLRLRG